MALQLNSNSENSMECKCGMNKALVIWFTTQVSIIDWYNLRLSLRFICITVTGQMEKFNYCCQLFWRWCENCSIISCECKTMAIPLDVHKRKKSIIVSSKMLLWLFKVTCICFMFLQRTVKGRTWKTKKDKPWVWSCWCINK